MDRIKVDNFLGLYTNVDESKLNPEYQSEAVNVRFRTGYIESEGYVASEAVLPPSVIYAQMVRLDEDRFKNKLDDQGELVPDYTQNLTDHMLSIIKDGNILRVWVDDEEVKYEHHLPITGDLVINIKVWNKNGVVILLINTGTYWLGKIDRLTTYPTPRNPGYYLYKYIDKSYNPSVISVETGSFADARAGATITLGGFKDLTVNGEDGKKYYLGFYNLVVNYENGLVQGEYPLIAIKDNLSGEDYIIKKSNFTIPLPGPGEMNFPAGDHWNKFIENVFIASNWLPSSSYDQIEEFLLATGITAKILTNQETSFTKVDTDFVFTYIFDKRDEYIVGEFSHKHTGDPYYIFKLSNFLFPGLISADKNYRITGIALYMRQSKNDDYEQVIFWDINSGKQDLNKFTLLYITGLTSSGIFLTQTSGVLYNKSDYKPIDFFTDFLEIEGVAYGINNGRVYFPSVGRGSIMNGVFNDYIPEVTGKYLADVNGALGVFDTQLNLIVTQDSREGYLLFSIKDKMNFKIRDQYDLATSPEGIIIHTKRGIYVTNGYERKLISEQINNIVEKNFDTGNIFYHRTEDILFYSYVDSKGNYHTFKFDFVYGNWSEVKGRISGKLTFSEDGIIHFLNEERGKVYKLDKTNNVYSVIRTPNVDLDYPFLGKNLIYIDVDFEGELNYENYKVTHTKRMTARLGVPVSKRIPNALIGARFIFKGKIYTIDIYYDAIGEFRHANHIPLSETIPEGVQQYPEFFKSITE